MMDRLLGAVGNEQWVKHTMSWVLLDVLPGPPQRSLQALNVAVCQDNLVPDSMSLTCALVRLQHVSHGAGRPVSRAATKPAKAAAMMIFWQSIVVFCAIGKVLEEDACGNFCDYRCL